jgi:hypothetical protein
MILSPTGSLGSISGGSLSKSEHLEVRATKNERSGRFTAATLRAGETVLA